MANGFNKTILYICLSEKWQTIERTVFRHCEMAKNRGEKIVLCCVKDSFLDLMSAQIGVERIHLKPKGRLESFNPFYQNKIYKILSEYQISLIHCHEIESLFPIAYFLFRTKHVSVVLTQINPVDHYYNSFWKQLFLGRVDLFIFNEEEIYLNARNTLKISPRKCMLLGGGVINSADIPEKRPADNENFKSVQHANIGIYVSPSITDVKYFDFLFNAFSVMNGTQTENRKVRLILVMDNRFAEADIYQQLSKYVEENLLDDFVKIYWSNVVDDVLKGIDLWVGNKVVRNIEDMAINALALGLPLLLPRKDITSEFFEIYSGVGRSFKWGDAREFRDKCQHIIANHDQYSHAVSIAQNSIMERYDYSTYADELFRLYEAFYRKRTYYFKRKSRI